MRESKIETYLVNRVKEAGGKAYKFVSPGLVGVPDRLVVFPGGNVYFVETKSPRGAMRSAQARAQKRLEVLGCRVEVCRSKEDVDIWIDGLTPYSRWIINQQRRTENDRFL